MSEYLETDYYLATTDVVTEDSIVHDILGDNTLTDDSDDEIIDVIHEVKSTRESAAASLKTLSAFLESQDDSSKFLNFLSEIEDYITDVTFRKPTKQLSTTSFTESDIYVDLVISCYYTSSISHELFRTYAYVYYSIRIILF